MRAEGLRPGMMWQVAWRDLLSTLRDTRTLRSTVLLPLLLLPLLSLGLPLLLGNLMGGQVQERQRVGVIGTLPPELRRLLTQPGSGGQGVELVPVADPVQAVRGGEAEAVIRVTRALPTQAGGAPVGVEVYAELGNLKSRSGAYAKVQSGVDAYNLGLARTRLAAAGLSEAVLTPVKVQSVDTRSPQNRSAGALAFLVPMLMLSFLLNGGLATALDSTAGEKERGTLESLLVSPVRRSEVVAGKLLATTLMALVTGLFSLLGFLGSGLLFSLLRPRGLINPATADLGGQLSLSAGSFLAMAGLVLSSALLISGALIALGIYARSYKEAQTYASPLSLLIVFPAVGLQFADFLARSAALYALPLFGGMVALLDTVKGQVTPGHALLAVGANLLGAALLGVFAWRCFGREEVIFRN